MSGFYFYEPFRAVLGNTHLLFGQTGAVASLASLLAVVGAFFAGWGVYSTNRHNRAQLNAHDRQARASRFAAGVELLNAEAISTKIAGLNTIRSLAENYPEEFEEISCDVLCAYAEQISADRHARVCSAQELNLDLPPVEKTYELAPRVLSAISAIRPNGWLQIGSLYLERFGFGKLKLTRANLNQLAIRRVSFNKVELIDCNISFACIENVRFTDTRLVNSTLLSEYDATPFALEFSDCDLAGVRLRMPHMFVSMSNCKLDGAKIAAQTIFASDCWYEKDKPDIFQLGPEAAVTVNEKRSAR